MPPPTAKRSDRIARRVIFLVGQRSAVRGRCHELGGNLQGFRRIGHRMRERELRERFTDARLRNSAAQHHAVQLLRAGGVIVELRSALWTTIAYHGLELKIKAGKTLPAFSSTDSRYRLFELSTGTAAVPRHGRKPSAHAFDRPHRLSASARLRVRCPDRRDSPPGHTKRPPRYCEPYRDSVPE